MVQPAALTLTQATEAGTVYRREEIAALATVARTRRLGVHVDGARFASAVATLGCAPADLTWRAGADLMSFGASKNGAIAAEAVLVFGREGIARHGERLAYLRKRSGHLISKLRFVSVQLEALLTDDLWLRNAAHANAVATRLAAGLAAVPGAELAYPVEANEVFVRLPAAVVDGLEADGFGFYRWPADDRPGKPAIRLVTSFDSDPADATTLVAAAVAANGG